VRIQDLGSRNGTYVNGRRIKSAELASGDRISLGTSVAEIAISSARDTNLGPAKVSASMAGKLDEFPLVDILQLVAGSRKSARLRIRSAGVDGIIDAVDGDVVDARMTTLPAASPMKAIVRMLAWRQGEFELQPCSPDAIPKAPLLISTQGLLMEATRQLDELLRTAEQLGGLNHHVMRGDDAALRPGSLLHAITSFVGHGPASVQTCLDALDAPDLEIARALAELVAAGTVLRCDPTGLPSAATNDES